MQNYGLYIHVPFCLRKCNYCDFLSYGFSAELADSYLLALFSEMAYLSKRYKEPELQTIYLGGGTPTCLSTDKLAQILKEVGKHFPVFDKAEITCEVNPATVNFEALQQMREAGFNRLSIGVQSFDDRLLHKLGRLHDVEAVFRVFQHARKAGFKNLNLDLIFAIPEQSRADWQSSLEQALTLHPEHLSLYNLKIEEGTPFYVDYEAGRLVPVDEDTDLWMYEEAIQRLGEAGLRQYEISNFAKSGYESRHNLRYWHYEPFLALGPGAHGYDGDCRYMNAGDMSEYIKAIQAGNLPWEEVIELSKKDQMEEFMMMGLRLMEGVDLAQFEHRFGQKLRDVYSFQIDKLTKLGLIVLENNHLHLTSVGVPLGNQVFQEFLL